MSFKPEVMVTGESDWLANGLCFATRQEAEDSAQDLTMRWTAVRDWRAVESTDPVNYSYHDHNLKGIET